MRTDANSIGHTQEAATNRGLLDKQDYVVTVDGGIELTRLYNDGEGPSYR